MPNPNLADATDNGVSADQLTGADLPTLTSEDSPRMRNLDAIAASRREQLEAEIGIPQEEDPAPAISQEAQLAAQLETPAALPVEKVKVKVEGNELEVSQEELIRTYQKNAAADKRLEEATRLLREAEALAATRAAAAAQAQEETPPAAQPQDDPVAKLREDAAATLSKLYDGDQEAATEALVGLILKAKGGEQPTQPAPGVNPAELTEQVLEQLSFKDALSKVQTDYPDLVADPTLERLTAMKAEELIAAGKTRSEALLTSAESIYQVLGKKPAGRHDTPAPTPANNTRQANKSRLDPVPAAHASALPASAPIEANPSSVIAELAAKRLGQSSAL